MSRWPRRRHGGPAPTGDHLAVLKAMTGAELVDHADGLINPPMPTAVFEALVVAIGVKGRRRDAAVCSVCGGRPTRSSQRRSVLVVCGNAKRTSTGGPVSLPVVLGGGDR